MCVSFLFLTDSRQCGQRATAGRVKLEDCSCGKCNPCSTRGAGVVMPNTPLSNPSTGTLVFGSVGEMKTRGFVLPAGEIRLLRGKHVGPNRGFGACHIWAEHKKEMAVVGFISEDNVPHYVAHIIRVGMPLFYSGDSFKKIRLMAVRASSGTAILEYREQRDVCFWSVVTAYSANKKHGTQVGTVLDVVVSQ